MRVVLEVLSGRLFSVEVEEDATVGGLKREIEKQENLPAVRLILLLDGAHDQERYSMDQDEASLKDYGVKDGSHIYIFFHNAETMVTVASPWSKKEPSHSTDSSSGPDEFFDDEPEEFH